MSLKERLKKNPRVKEFVLWMIYPKRRPRPRWWVRWFVNPFFHKRGRGSYIYRRTRMDVFPFNEFRLGKEAVVEDFVLINNGAGDVIIGDKARVGVGTTIIGPVTMGNGSDTGQNAFVAGFNHGYNDGEINSSDQPLDIRPVVIGDDSHVGANSVVVAGVTIGRRCQIGAGSVVTKDIPDFSIAVGNPAKIIKRYNHDTKQWEKV